MTTIKQQLSRLSDDAIKALFSINRGVEREALRVDAQNFTLCVDEHPAPLGKALTHETITTDYSESLLEFITPVSKDIDETINQLTDIHKFVTSELNNQVLWPISMPCYVGDVADIPIARYGQSNVGRMKSTYRMGLTHRYGAMMQIISGVHFNFSFEKSLFKTLQADNFTSSADPSEHYFSLIRQYQKDCWLLPYLFGASPMICPSFIRGQENKLNLQKHDSGYLYLPYATSLRMSDLGYTNKEQSSLGIDYNNLENYVQSVNRAIKKPSDSFKKIGVKVDGEYKQLNDRVLQIENELYSSIRPKRVAKSSERPSEALANGGVEYIEVRALDVNPFSPIGIQRTQMLILDLFLIRCLLMPSYTATDATEKENSENLNKVILQGRNPELTLSDNGQTVAISDWLKSIYYDLRAIANVSGNQSYIKALNTWRAAFFDPRQTLSGRMMRTAGESGQTNWVKSLNQQHYAQIAAHDYHTFNQADFEAMCQRSIDKQQQIEQNDKVSFDEFLADYFSYLQ